MWGGPGSRGIPATGRITDNRTGNRTALNHRGLTTATDHSTVIAP
ncbi:hypothetical protein FrEUN1fDRAFT_4759 [Parafrankia sp. EUN1f]|nr:hypothetical protein FrEUN1fDRAFT_4759 [Parafrankia sp. EUN1f]